MSKAIVLLSGGQDSTTCLFWAKQRFCEVEAITFDYGQRHKVEVDIAGRVAELAELPHKVFHIDTFRALGGNSLVDASREISQSPGTLPNTFVPARNYILLGFAANYAYQRGVHDLVIGVNQIDYSGYPDCRDDSIRSVQTALINCLDYQIRIHAPLLWLDKPKIASLAEELGCLDIIRELSHSCYQGVPGGCGECPACKLRIR